MPNPVDNHRTAKTGLPRKSVNKPPSLQLSSVNKSQDIVTDYEYPIYSLAPCITEEQDTWLLPNNLHIQ